MAGLMTSRALADGFATGGMEFFATFGGCTVAPVCGLAVLDVIREEGLQANAAAVGAHCLKRLRDLQVGGGAPSSGRVCSVAGRRRQGSVCAPACLPAPCALPPLVLAAHCPTAPAPPPPNACRPSTPT
jgi:adenosylmethionine-8-amino-7-oxononanoate aminotransferase